MTESISILLINPWIIDFAAYNLWAEPLGLLYIGSIVKKAGADVSYIDCLTSIEEKNPKPKANGCSKYRRKIIDKPRQLDFVERAYARYGMSEEEFTHHLDSHVKPDAVLVTSMMTYWYPGVFRAIEIVKEHYAGKVPVILGGIYAQLCSDHATMNSQADFIHTGGNIGEVLSLIERITGKKFQHKFTVGEFSDFPPPLHELGRGRHFFAVLTRRGCPFNCSYCASRIINPTFSRRSENSVLHEITTYSNVLGTGNVAFYDDALLMDAERHFIPILTSIRDRGLKLTIHLPNGIHARFVTPDLAILFREAGVKTIWIGLETSDQNLQRRTGNKTSNEEYRRAVELLRETGYSRQEIGTYAMVGFPGQRAQNVEKTIRFIYKSGGAPHLSYFSPIPHTKIWPDSVRSTPFPIETEPLFHNNTVFILRNKNLSPKNIGEFKTMAIDLRRMP